MYFFGHETGILRQQKRASTSSDSKLLFGVALFREFSDGSSGCQSSPSGVNSCYRPLIVMGAGRRTGWGVGASIQSSASNGLLAIIRNRSTSMGITGYLPIHHPEIQGLRILGYIPELKRGASGAPIERYPKRGRYSAGASPSGIASCKSECRNHGGHQFY